MNQHKWAKEITFTPNTPELQVDCHANYMLQADQFVELFHTQQLQLLPWMTTI